MQDVTTALADRFGLSDEERQERMAGSQQFVIYNRVAWAKLYLKKAGLIEQPGRGVVRITDQGRAVLAKKPPKINIKFLRDHSSSFAEWTSETSEAGNDESSSGIAEPVSDMATPEEALETANKKLQAVLADELLERMKACSPAFFERLVVALLVKMGYGGSGEDAGKAIGKSGDGGIDGTIKEDRLGLDMIYIQAKRWQGTVGRPEVAGFSGSMEATRGRKGVLLTTGTFSKEAKAYIEKIERKIVLIDGRELAQLMIELDVGVTTVTTYRVKKLDVDYFDEQEEA